jgi:TRAP-type C4-dicarboxylate transport system permease small subunit
MKSVQRVLAWVFGAIFLALSVVVSVETLARKLFNYSIQGADELGGYSLAAGSVIAFSLALFGRNHIRVDVFHERFGKRMQAWMNALSYVLLAVLAVVIAFVAFKVVADTLSYKSTAPTPWQTPLIYPQSIWYAGLVVFALVTVAYAARAVWLLARGDIERVNLDYPPRSAKQEVKEELDDFAQRRGEAKHAPSKVPHGHPAGRKVA